MDGKMASFSAARPSCFSRTRRCVPGRGAVGENHVGVGHEHHRDDDILAQFADEIKDFIGGHTALQSAQIGPLDDRPLGGRVRERDAQAVNRVLPFSYFVFCTNTKAPGLAVPGAMEKIGYSEVIWPCTQQAAGRWSATWPWHLPASCRPQQRRGGRR